MTRRERLGGWVFYALGGFILAALVWTGVAECIPKDPPRPISVLVWVGIAVKAGFLAWVVLLWARRDKSVRLLLGFIAIVQAVLSVADGVSAWSRGSMTAPLVIELVVGLLQVPAALGMFFLPNVRAYYRFWHTGISEDASVTNPTTVFISYRRKDCPEVVHPMCDRLKEVFGEKQVFLDERDIPPLSRFPDVLKSRLMEANIVIVVIGPRWTEGRRLYNEDDWVRQEVMIALASQRRLLPLLVAGADMPRQSDLPEALHGLMTWEARRLQPGPEFDRDLDRLIETLIGSTLTEDFELGCDHPFDPTRTEDILHAQQVNDRFKAAVAPQPLWFQKWEGPKLRMRYKVWQGTVEELGRWFQRDRLKSLTGVKWDSFTPVSEDAASRGTPLPPQTAGAVSGRYRERTKGLHLVCHLQAVDLYAATGTEVIATFDTEAEEAKRYVGEPKRNTNEIRVYITRKWVWKDFSWFTYVHSNFMKEGAEYPTKIITTAGHSLLTLLLDLMYDGQPTALEYTRATTLHRDVVKYLINERTVGTEGVIYHGALNIEFVRVPKRK